ncbi:hypothetical protein NFC81_09030 [Salinispirillum sp. LH 10-3-1]|uniref:Phosphatidate cytidylyltransferase n=1 Tax=Salinispirillum sp. LH 10-3-1 TaxID=2952525 RepID=A0AB38YC34_9GAMM
MEKLPKAIVITALIAAATTMSVLGISGASLVWFLVVLMILG